MRLVFLGKVRFFIGSHIVCVGGHDFAFLGPFLENPYILLNLLDLLVLQVKAGIPPFMVLFVHLDFYESSTTRHPSCTRHDETSFVKYDEAFFPDFVFFVPIGRSEPLPHPIFI